MSPPRPPDSRRAEALALLEQFAAQLLPGVLRRIAPTLHRPIAAPGVPRLGYEPLF